MRLNSLILSLVVLGMFSCASTPTQTASRLPSSLQNETTYFEFLQNFVRENGSASSKLYRIRNFPLRNITDIEDGTELWKEFEGIQSRLNEEAIDAIFNYRENESVQAHELRISELKTKTFAKLNSNEKAVILEACVGKPMARGTRVRASDLLQPGYRTCSEHIDLLVSDEEIQKAFYELPLKAKFAVYDGDLGFHRYNDESLAKHVRILGVTIFGNRARFQRIFQALPESLQSRYRQDRDGFGDQSQTEVFDLVANMAVHLMMSKTYGVDPTTRQQMNKIQVSKLVRKGLARALKMGDPASDHLTQVPSLSVLRSEDQISVFCANGIFESKNQPRTPGSHHTWFRSSTSNGLVDVWSLSSRLSDLESKGATVLPFLCNTNSYRFIVRTKQGELIPEPGPISVSPREDFHALMTISLVSEIDQSAIEKGRFLISKLGGWTIDEDLKEVETEPFFAREFRQADAYIPVMHAMDVNYFNIGTGHSTSLRLSREVPGVDGQMRRLRLTVLFPRANSSLQPLIMGPAELAKIFDDRYREKGSSLFLMNNSCGSDQTLLAWSLVFRKALAIRQARGEAKDLSQITDFPHIIGSKRYFSTSSVTQVFSHAEFPLTSLQMLTAGQSVSEVMQFLEKPASVGFIDRLTRMVGMGGSDEEIDSKSKSFEPVYSGDHPKLRDFEGFEITIQGRGIKGELTY